MELVMKGSRDVERQHVDEFTAWFVNKAFQLRDSGAAIMTEELFSLATGTMMTSTSYTACVVNGVKFVTTARDANRKTQSSGVYVAGVDGDGFYGQLEEVLVMHYTLGSVIIMRCRWFDTDNRKKRKKVIHNITSIYTGAEWFKDEPFVMSTQIRQVFYTDDMFNGPAWKVVHHHDPRHVWDLPDAPEQEIVVDSHIGNFELVIDLPQVDPIAYHMTEAIDESVVDETVILLCEEDAEFPDEHETDDTADDYEESASSGDTEDVDDNEDTSDNADNVLTIDTSDEE